jgi:hypothetical protein
LSSGSLNAPLISHPLAKPKPRNRLGAGSATVVLAWCVGVPNREGVLQRLASKHPDHGWLAWLRSTRWPWSTTLGTRPPFTLCPGHLLAQLLLLQLGGARLRPSGHFPTSCRRTPSASGASAPVPLHSAGSSRPNLSSQVASLRHSVTAPTTRPPTLTPGSRPPEHSSSHRTARPDHTGKRSTD